MIITCDFIQLLYRPLPMCRAYVLFPCLGLWSRLCCESTKTLVGSSVDFICSSAELRSSRTSPVLSEVEWTEMLVTLHHELLLLLLLLLLASQSIELTTAWCSNPSLTASIRHRFFSWSPAHNKHSNVYPKITVKLTQSYRACAAANNMHVDTNKLYLGLRSYKKSDFRAVKCTQYLKSFMNR